jgi:hypothetical protein
MYVAEIKNKMVFSGINHNVDELLVGIYTQISLRRHQQAQANQHGRGSKVYNRILLSGFPVFILHFLTVCCQLFFVVSSADVVGLFSFRINIKQQLLCWWLYFSFGTALLFDDIYSVFTFPNCLLRQITACKIYSFSSIFSLQGNF